MKGGIQSPLLLLASLELPFVGFYFGGPQIISIIFSVLRKKTSPVLTETNAVYISDLLKQGQVAVYVKGQRRGKKL